MGVQAQDYMMRVSLVQDDIDEETSKRQKVEPPSAARTDGPWAPPADPMDATSLLAPAMCHARSSPKDVSVTPEPVPALLALPPPPPLLDDSRTIAAPPEAQADGEHGEREDVDTRESADLDVELLAPLDALLNQTATLGASAMLGQEPLPHAVLLERQPRQICNAVLASARGHPFWLWALHMAALRVSTDQGWGDPVGSTGPRMLEQAVIKWQARHANTELSLQIAQPDTFFPLWDSMQKETFEARCLFNDYANQSETWPRACRTW
jgi:hypothetical protein